MVSRNAKREGTAAAGGRFDIDLAPVILQNAVNQGQAEATAARLGGEERFEDMADIVTSDPVAGVFDLYHQVLLFDRGDQSAVFDDCRRSIAVIRVDSENEHRESSR